MSKKHPFDITLDAYEQEIEDALPDEETSVPETANLAEVVLSQKKLRLTIYAKITKLILGYLATMLKA